MGIKIGPIEIDTDFSSSETTLASSSSDEEKKMNKKAAKGKDKKYQPESVSGYDSIVGKPKYKKKGSDRSKTKCLPPPPPPVDPQQNKVPPSLPEKVGEIDKDTVRDALLHFVSENCCYGKAPAQEMEFSELHLNSAYRYVLETFTENRKVKWRSDGYSKGQKVDAAKAGTAPEPWEMDTKNKALFKNEKQKIEVPKTASVRKCWYCKGKGRVKCRCCKGSGKKTCPCCQGEGERPGPEGPEPCGFCGGSGEASCGLCIGRGFYDCKTCKAKKKLKWFIQLSVKWKNNKVDFIEEQTDLPDELVREVKGEKIYEDEQVLVQPLTNFPLDSINEQSKTLVEQQTKAYPDERIMKQRQTVTVIPVTEVEWKWNDDSGKFFVYGLNNKVWFPDYPKKCCCSIL